MALNTAIGRFLLFLVIIRSSLLSATEASETIENLIRDEKVKCESGTDDMACIKERAMRLIDTIITRDNYKIGDVEVKANDYQRMQSETETEPKTGRAMSKKNDFFDIVEHYIQGHDVTMNLPLTDDAKITISSRNLPTNDEFNVIVRFANNDDDDNNNEQNDMAEGRRKKGGLFKKVKKHRLRKMALPLMVIILLKAITIIPMALGILKIKALNALGLGFLSFIVSVGLAIFQFCKKIATEHHSSHGHWSERALNLNAGNILELYEPSPTISTATNSQHMAYNAYV